MKNVTKLLSLLLALVLITGLLPTAALAAEDTGTDSSRTGSTDTGSLQSAPDQGSDSIPQGQEPQGAAGGTENGALGGTDQGTGDGDSDGSGGGTSDSGKSTPQPAVISRITLQAGDKVYDGTTGNAPVTLSFPGLSPAPEAGDYALTAVYTSPNVTADEAPNLSISFSLTEAGQAKYILGDSLSIPAAIFGRITPAPLTLKAKDQVLPEGVEDMAEGPDQVTLNPVPGETAAVTRVTLTLQDGKILPSDAEITVTNAEGVSTLGNYTLGYESGSLTLQTAVVTREPAVPGTPDQPLVYTGLAQPLLIPGTAQNGALEYSLQSSPLTLSGDSWSPWSTEVPQAIAAGTYRLRWRAAGAPGYRSTEPRELSVTLAPQVISLTATARKTYDGSLQVPKKDGYDDLLIDLEPLSGKQITVTGVTGSTFAAPGVGSDISVTPGSITLAGEDAPNYTVRLTVTGEILPRPVTLTLGAEKKYGTPDPPVSWTVTGGSLVTGETLDLTITRDPGENAGESYAYHAALGSNPNYTVRVKEGKLTVHPAKPLVELTLNRTSRHPGQAVTLTVTARNGEAALISSGWNQPQAPLVRVNGGALTLTRKNQSAQDPDGDYPVWTAQYKIPKSAKGKLTFEARMDDDSGNYLEGQSSARLTILKAGTNPDTGDSQPVGLYIGLALGSAAALGILIWLLIKSKNSRES